jgi:syntaxin 5
MSCDRTAEFFEILQTYDGGASSDGSSTTRHSSSPTQSSSSVNGGGGYIRGKNSIRQATPSEFSQGAADVSFRVQRTAAKLEELTRMVQGSDMFGDHTVRINRLSLSIKQEMTDLKGDLDKLAEAVGMQQQNSSAGGSSSDGRKDGTSVIHSQRMVDSLRMQLGETTKDFQAALQIRATKLREEQDRRHRMGFTDASSTIIQRPLAFGPPGGGGMGGGIGGLQPIGRPAAPMNGMSDNDGSSMMMQATSSPLQLSESQLVDRNLDYLESRADAVQTINQTMGELNSVFSNLLQLIDIQGQSVARIDDNVTVGKIIINLDDVSIFFLFFF